tara:strand:+ start:631 stop:1212 length:582 start_codon:yes stop_codon:yes gene_type:complete
MRICNALQSAHTDTVLTQLTKELTQMRILEQENVKEFIAFLNDPLRIETKIYHLNHGDWGEDIYQEWQRVKSGRFNKPAWIGVTIARIVFNVKDAHARKAFLSLPKEDQTKINTYIEYLIDYKEAEAKKYWISQTVSNLAAGFATKNEYRLQNPCGSRVLFIEASSEGEAVSLATLSGEDQSERWSVTQVGGQ